MKAASLPLLLCILSLLLACSASYAAPPTVTVRPVPADKPPATYGHLEFSVTVSGGASPYGNPFDPEEIAVDAIFAGPGGRILRIPGFWHEAFRRETRQDGGIEMVPAGAGEKSGFRVRVAPTAAGRWTLTVMAKDKAGTGRSAPLSVTVAASRNPGFVRRAAGNSRYFQRDDGSPYFLVGENVCWSGRRGLADYEDWFGALGKAGGNFARLWMAFSPLESKATGLGRYDLKNAAYFDEVLTIAEKNGLACMMAFGTYGEFNTGGFFNEGSWPVNPYNAVNGGPIPTDKPDQFFTDATARAFYRKRLRYLIARYGAFTSMGFWEFWNEKGGPASWYTEMAGYLKQNDPYRHLVTNSYSTTGEAEIWNIPDIDLTQTHRYGDEGSLRDIAPVVINDALAHDDYKKPHLMGEFGISWRGGDEKFDPKNSAINLHNGLWSGAMSGNAGGSAIWWWDGYVHPKRWKYADTIPHAPQQGLYGEFAALAAFVKNIDWPRRDFQPLRLGEPTRRLTGPETFRDAVLSASGEWGYVQKEAATLLPGGEASGGSLPGFLYGPAKPEMQAPARLKVTLAKPSKLHVRVASVSQSARLRIAVNGKEAGSFAFNPNPDGPRGYESTKQFPEYGGIYQAVFNKTVTVPVPAGESLVELSNAEGDWLTLATVTVENARSSRFAALQTLALQDSKTGETLIWLQDPESNWYNDFHGNPVERQEGVRLTVPLPRAQQVRVEWWDTRAGKVVRMGEANGRTIVLDTPAFERDIAVRIVPVTQEKNAMTDNSASVVRVVKEGERHRLVRNGQPFFIQGAVGSVHLDPLVAAGGNAIRAGVAHLDKAAEKGLTVLAGLPFGKQRWGFDYGDRAAVEKQLDEIKEMVRRHKDHPALLMWALGNELEIHTTPEQRVVLWKAVNEAAAAIHKIDPNHPVITVIGSDYKRDGGMLKEMDEHCPALDAVGLNMYVDMLTVPEEVSRQNWKRPYLITEFGPRGHWQVPKTAWKMPIEDTSTEKAEFYAKAYDHAVKDRPQCLGAYVFHWAQHHEKTHTWYGMFLEDGSPTGAVDVMQQAWTGKWPVNRCPSVSRIEATLKDGGNASEPNVFPPGALLRCRVEAGDPDGDAVTISWDVRKDVANNPNVGGDREEPTPPIDGAVVEAGGQEAVIRLPEQAGPYRVFVYVRDPGGRAATANLPVLARASN